MSSRDDIKKFIGMGGRFEREDPALLGGTRYRVIRRLANGGMGEIFEAEHVGLKKLVVMKLLHTRLDERHDIVDRMRIEAQALAVLCHPNIVQVSDFGETEDGRTYLVMERLYGRTLREELKERGAVPVAEAIDFVRQALAGLGAAHGAGIIHRDIKLDNIFLCDAQKGDRSGETGRHVKLLDFGVVKMIAEGTARAGAPAPLAFPTEDGILIGTPSYFSPEQARGQPVDARSDIYSIGLVLYKLVAGRGPFDDIRHTLKMLAAHTDEEPAPPSRYAAQPVPAELEQAILKALAKSPANRFLSTADFSAELERVAARISGVGAPFKPRWESTEPLTPLEQAPSGSPSPWPAPPSQKKGLAGGATDRIPELAAIIDAQRRAASAMGAGARCHGDVSGANPQPAVAPRSPGRDGGTEPMQPMRWIPETTAPLPQAPLSAGKISSFASIASLLPMLPSPPYIPTPSRASSSEQAWAAAERPFLPFSTTSPTYTIPRSLIAISVVIASALLFGTATAFILLQVLK